MEEKTDFVFVARPERVACWSWSPTADLLWSGTHQNPTDRQRHVFNTTEPLNHSATETERSSSFTSKFMLKRERPRAKIQERKHLGLKGSEGDQKNTDDAISFMLQCVLDKWDRSPHSAYVTFSPFIYIRARGQRSLQFHRKVYMRLF